MSLREKILAATQAFRVTRVDCPEFPEPLFVRPMSVGGMSRFLQLGENGTERSHAAVARIMIGECLCDEAGVRVFAEGDAEQIDGLPSTVASKLVDAINGLSSTKDDHEAEKAAGN